MHPTADFASRTFQKPPLIRKCSKSRHSFEASPLSSGDYRRKARPSQAITFQKPPLIGRCQLNRRSFEQRSHFRRLSPPHFSKLIEVRTLKPNMPSRCFITPPLKILGFCPLAKAATRLISKQSTHIELFCISSIFRTVILAQNDPRYRSRSNTCLPKARKSTVICRGAL